MIANLIDQEYNFVHKTVKQQKKLNEQLLHHKEFSSEVHEDHVIHFKQIEDQLKSAADAYQAQTKHHLDENHNMISMAQAQVKGYHRELDGKADPNEDLFNEDLQKFTEKAKKRYRDNLILHEHNATKHANTKHNIP